MRTWMSLLVVLLSLPVLAADELAPPQLTIYEIGNEDQLGGGALLRAGEWTWWGVDGRWIDDNLDTWVASFVVQWSAVPEVVIPVGGLFPQVDLPVPPALTATLNLGGRVGYQRHEAEYVEGERGCPVVAFTAELDFCLAGRASFGLWYERQLDSGVWGDLSDDPLRDQVFLCLKQRF